MKPFCTTDAGGIGGDRIRLSGHAREDAAAWSDALCQYPEDADLRNGFLVWRAASSRNAAAFDALDQVLRYAREACDSNAVMAMRASTLARVAMHSKRRNHRYAGLTAALAATLVVVVTAAWFSGGSWKELKYLQESAVHALKGDTLYRTAPGQRLAVTLQDGTLLTLNTDSRAIVRYRDGQRGVNLVEGQALFEVAKDPHHPFIVTAGGRKVTALGTAFDVRVSRDRFAVTLIEGRISVEPDGPSAPGASTAASAVRAELSPGEQLVVAAAIPAPVIRKADAKRAISWRDGQVIFQNDPLAQAVSEINRYGGRRIVLADESLNDLRISGAFNTGNTSGFVATLTSYFDVRVVESDAQRIVLASRN